MFSQKKAGPVLALLGATALTIGVAQSAGASTAKPSIVARPDSVMVNTDTHLTGSNFPADSKLTIVDCNETKWLKQYYPCVTSIMVTTDAAGAFSHKMKVGRCPDGIPKVEPRGTSKTCFIGEEVKGRQMTRLVGTTKITVTGP